MLYIAFMQLKLDEYITLKTYRVARKSSLDKQISREESLIFHSGNSDTALTGQ